MARRRKRRRPRKIRILFVFGLVALIILGGYKEGALRFGDFKSLEKVIVIDAGHGGTDPGTIGFGGNYEKDINLAISRKLAGRLKEAGYKIISTRDDDDYVDNIERADLANKKRARVFISIHGNALENNTSTHGVQVLYYPNRTSTIGDLDNNELAKMIMTALIDGTGAVDKGIKERKELIVLNQTKMPAIIIECGFLSNEKEEALLLTDSYQNQIVDSVIDGLEEYFSLNSSQDNSKNRGLLEKLSSTK